MRSADATSCVGEVKQWMHWKIPTQDSDLVISASAMPKFDQENSHPLLMPGSPRQGGRGEESRGNENLIAGNSQIIVEGVIRFVCG